MTSAQRFCANCGQATAEGAIACMNCGHPVASSPLAKAAGASPPTDGKAIAALICGIGGFTFCPVLSSIAAIILGVQAKRSIAASGGAVGGEGLATAGTVLGFIGLGISTLVALIFMASFGSVSY